MHCNLRSRVKREVAIKSDTGKGNSQPKVRKRCPIKAVPKESEAIPKYDSFKTPINKSTCSKEISPYRKSTTAGWKRAFIKLSPSSEIKASPLKATQANLQSILLENPDKYLDIFTWVVNMSEQFFYDNTLLLLNGSKNDISLMKKRIRRNYEAVDIEFFKSLVNIILLGKGTYGSVYKATDKTTAKVYAIKYISSKSKDTAQHCSNILDYMAERNAIIRAMNSPFIMNFYYSLHMKSAGGMFLFFEYCIGDLFVLMGDLTLDDLPEISKRLYKNNKEIIQDLDKDVEMLDIMLMYIFEMFCGLDFLVQANIIHQDIKLENLMVSQILHLKIGDFGLVYRTRIIHRESNSLLVKHDEIDKIESSNYELSTVGTPDYEDLELKLMELEDDENPLFDDVLENQSRFNTKKLRYDEEILEPSFLTDTWAAGIVSINLLFRGFHLFDPDMISDDILPGVPRTSVTEFLVHVVGRQALYKKYVQGGLVNSGGHSHQELMEFIASIFLPREVRSKRYTKKKVIYKYSKKIRVSYIDMVKIENIHSFKERNFNSKTIFTLTVPEKVRGYFKKKNKTKFATFDDLLKSITKTSKGKMQIEMKPGITINYFQ